MDKKFHPAIEAMRAGDVEKLRSLIAADPSLATSRSSRSHPTLLQALVLDGKGKPKNIEMVQVLIDADAELNEPLVAAASINKSRRCRVVSRSRRRNRRHRNLLS